MNKEPNEGLQNDWHVDNEDDEDYREPLRVPRNRENVFGAIPGNLIFFTLQSSNFVIKMNTQQSSDMNFNYSSHLLITFYLMLTQVAAYTLFIT